MKLWSSSDMQRGDSGRLFGVIDEVLLVAIRGGCG